MAAGSTDAVTGGQLFGVQKDLKDSIKGAQDTANSALQTVSVKVGQVMFLPLIKTMLVSVS